MYYSRILCGNNADPTILEEGGKYYMTVSSFRYLPGLTLYESEDLLHWKKVNTIPVGALSDVWAPDLCKIGSRYFIYFPTDGQNHAVYTDDLYGKWEGPVAIGGRGLIDPGYIRDRETGRGWLFFNNGSAAPLAEDGLSLAEEPRVVYPAWKYPDEWITEGENCEGPKLFFRNGWYYLTVAEGGTAGPPTSHMAVMMRSRRLDGGWEFSPYNPVIRTRSADERWLSAGHATPFRGPDGRWHFILHAYERGRYNEGRQVIMCDAAWTEDGWPVALDRTAPDVDPQNAFYDFSAMTEKQLFADFSLYGKFQPERVRFADGCLRLAGCGEDASRCRPLLLNGTAGNYTLTATFAADLCTCPEYGLLFYYSEQCEVGVCMKDGEIYVFSQGWYRHREGGFQGKTLCLRIEKKDDVLTYFYGRDADNMRKISVSSEVSGFHHNAFGGFLSLRPGMYALGQGSLACRSLEIRYF